MVTKINDREIFGRIEEGSQVTFSNPPNIYRGPKGAAGFDGIRFIALSNRSISSQPFDTHRSIETTCLDDFQVRSGHLDSFKEGCSSARVATLSTATAGASSEEW